MAKSKKKSAKKKGKKEKKDVKASGKSDSGKESSAKASSKKTSSKKTSSKKASPKKSKEASSGKAESKKASPKESSSEKGGSAGSNGRIDERELLSVLNSVKGGDFSARFDVVQGGAPGRVADTLNAIIEQNAQMCRELSRISNVVGKKGRIEERAALPAAAGSWQDCVEAVNELIVDLGQPITEVERVIGAVAKGDLSQKMELEADGHVTRGEFLRTGKLVNKMVDQLSEFASEVTRVAREVGTEGKLGGQADVPGVSGTWKDLTDNVNSMANNLTGQVRNIAEVTTAVATGDLSKKITVEAAGEVADLKNTINTMVDQLSAFADQVTRVAREVGTEGKLGGQAEVPGVSGTWEDLTNNVNSMANNLTAQVRGISEVTTAVANGDLSKKITVEAAGEVADLKNTINTMVDQLSAFADQVTRVAREVGTEGILGGQAEVPGVSGTWEDLTDNVNSMANNLTGQVRNIAEVTTAVAMGDLSKKITVEAAGEVAELKDTINTMVDQLSAFASEVTRVAREVGTEGQLGGQAEVPGVSGTWKDLTDNVNSMADNLTAQVRNIAEVTTAVANGDLSKKITVDVQGEILSLKDTINTMVDQLSAFASEVTRVSREVGTEGILGGQAQVPAVSGTWEDLTNNVNSMADNLTAQVREISEVTTAVAVGDLSKKITVEAAGEVAELKDTINTMVDQLSAFASEVTRVAREVGTEGQLGGQAEVPGVSGTWEDLTDNVNIMANNLTTQVRGIADVTTAVANGDLSKKITIDAKGEIQELKNTINTMVDQLSSFASEVTRVAREVGTEGILGGQAEVPGVSGTWENLTDNVNIMANNLTTQVRGIADVTTAVANGDLSKKITIDVQGEVAELKDTINTMVDQLSAFASEVTRVAREVGTEGILGGQAEVPGVSGTWKDLTDGVNFMADNLTTQVRGIAKVVTSVARGDLTQKLTVDAKGEIAELANTINGMIETLDTFADQVTTVAREVGVEGQLGGQAYVPGASGTWRDLTDNVNQLASNLTSQVRAITEVTTAVAAGDLTKKITVDAAGEVADLKDNVNEMIRNLKETTRQNKEQDWLKTNLTKFTQLLQGQDDLLTVSKVILSELAPLVNVQHGLFYIAEYDEEHGGDTELKLMASYAHRERKHLANRFKLGEGLIGQCALEKERILVGNVPAEYVHINSGLGDAAPLNIVVLPVIFETEVKAVLELASFTQFEDIHLTFLEQLTESIGIVLNTVEANMRTETLLEQSQSLTQELQSRQSELTDTNTRLEQQAESLRESEELLKEQQEELQQTNRELQDKARLLAEQKDEVERKNREIELARSSIEEKAEQLALTSKYKSQFLANMSHELRTPLNSMLILSKMLSDDSDGDLSPKQIEFAETIHSSGADLLGLINEILDLSKIESGAMGVDVTEVYLEEISGDLERLFGEVANEKDLRLEIDVDESVPESLTTDAKRLEQVLKNLLSNAIKFTTEGEVTLSVVLADEEEYFNLDSLNRVDTVLAFEVRDTGPGIAEEKQRVIFEAFQQADGTVSRTHGGTGLGLSISREIARLLGGEIHLSSTEGEGSTFTFFLPETYSPTSLSSDEGDAPTTTGDMIDEEMQVRAAVKLDEPSDAGRPDYPSFGNGGSTVEELASAAGRGQTSEAVDVETAREEAEEAVEPVESPNRQTASVPQGNGAKASVAVEDSPMRPTAPEHAAEEAARPRAARVPDDRNSLEGGERILLIIEDDARFARILKDMAHEKDFKCLIAPSAEEGLQMARRYDVDAITLDIELPGMHGLTMLDQLKNNSDTRHIPVHIVSVSEELPRGQRRGAMGQIKKPVSREAIAQSFERIIGFMSRGKRRLLVLEDNEAQRLSISQLVQGDDVEIVAVGTGEDALAELREKEFDCAVIDLGLPDMEGFDIIETIRNELELMDLPIVVHTARELEAPETTRLNRLVEAIIVKDIESYDRLLDETALHLHRVETNLPEEKQRRLRNMHKPEASLAGKKIMIVDDDVRNIFAVTSLLERHKMDVVYAESGKEGIEMLNKNGGEIDAVLMDIMMPGMDGYEATRTIRKMPRFKSMPIIAVTAKAMKGDREKCIEAGASDYITKPVNVEQLTSLLRVWLTN